MVARSEYTWVGIFILKSSRSGLWSPPGSHVGLPGSVTLWYLLLLDLVAEATCNAGAYQPSALAFFALRMIPWSVGGREGGQTGGKVTEAPTEALVPCIFWKIDMM
jgi:hypothetical protein